MQGQLTRKCGREAIGYRGIREHEGMEVMWRQRELVHEHRNISKNQGRVHDGIGAVGVQVFERDEHASASVQTNGTEKNWKQAFCRASHNIRCRSLEVNRIWNGPNPMLSTQDFALSRIGSPQNQERVLIVRAGLAASRPMRLTPP